MADRSEQVDLILSAAVELLTPGERTAFIRDACGGDDELQRQVEELVDAYLSAGAFLESPAPSLPPTVDLGLAESSGTQLGRYKLLQQIGEGGFAVVFMAEQELPVRRRVAVKIIKPGMDSRQVIARFEAERQALAMMDHSNIAKMLDAGTTETGRPYFVMELVKGTPITEYCDEHRLSIDQRLELFSQVCDAVQHAHQKGVIHRDIKPSNVLVRTQDDKPVVKVIDFGIAKATETRLTDMTLFTEFRQLIGTPAYMSPEQADGSLDIDTRTDVYSLGVLLYELLSGSPPFDPRELKSKAVAEMQRIIREVDPLSPSVRLSTLDAETRTIKAKARGFEPDRLAQRLRGELDWIALRALEKDRDRRYRSAAALADDLQRYLTNEPVEARPATAGYRFRKFARRNKVAVMAGFAIACALIIGLILATLGLVQARRQARIAKVNLTEAYWGWALTANAENDAESAERRAREALVLSKELFGEDHPSVHRSLHILALVLARSKPEEAIALERESIAGRKRYSGEIEVELDLELAYSFDVLADLLRRKGEVAEAAWLYREALTAWRKHMGNKHLYVANTLDHMAVLLLDQGKHADAEACLREALAIYRHLFGEENRRTIRTFNNLLGLLNKEGRESDAEALLREGK